MRFYNTFAHKIENFKPLNPPIVGLYTCGITAYDSAHIGHGRKYVNDDILRRTLEYLGYKVKHVQNVTDVGHLVSDADEGEDKLERGARKAGKTVWEVADFFTKHFYESMDRLNVLRPQIICRATEHIPQQIALVQRLLDRGCAYDTPEAVYFDVTKFPDYGRLTAQKLDEKKVAVRTEVETGEYKKNPADFVLWFKQVGRFADHVMHWKSPWGEGFPGWHIECSAMSMHYLGEKFDIHTGGVDHIPVHHPNEIAQAEATTGKQFVRYWLHHEFLMVDGKKMSKSLGNTYTVDDICRRGFEPLDLRYFYLTAHYRTVQNFTWEALQAAYRARLRLTEIVEQWDYPKIGCAEYEQRFQEAIADDLNVPRALAIMWELVKSDYPASAKHKSLLKFDKVLGLRLDEIGYSPPAGRAGKLDIRNLSHDLKALVKEREDLRFKGDWKKADQIREEIRQRGYRLQDSPTGPKISQIKSKLRISNF